MATISDVALKAGVSTTTVSRIINNYSPVNKETKKKVLNVMKELHYSPSPLAQGMRRQKTKTIGIIIPTHTNYGYSELLNFIEMEARSHGYLPIVCTREIDSETGFEHINELIRRQVDGFILCWYHGINLNRQYLLQISQETPIVLMDQPSGDLPVSSVYSDGYQGMKEMVNALIAKGLHRIAFMKFHEDDATSDNRFEGYKQSLKENGLKLEQQLIVCSDYCIDGGYEAAGKLLMNESPDALATVGDFMAIGALKYCYDHKLNVPEDISITGFDNVPFATVVTPTLTSVAQPTEEMARLATGQLIRKIENKKTKNKDFILDTELVFRGSTI